MSKQKKAKIKLNDFKYKDTISRYKDYVSAVFIFIFLAIFPLLVDKGIYTNITRFKFQAFAAISQVFLIVMIITAIVASIHVNKQIRKHDFKARCLYQLKHIQIPQLIAAAYFIWCTISALKSPYGSDCFIGQSRYEGWLSMFLYITIFMLASNCGRFRPIYMYGMSLAATVMGILALLQEKGSTIMYPEGYDYTNSSFLATIGHHDCYAGIASIFFPVLFAAFILLPRDKHKIDFRPTLLIGAFLVLLSFIYSDVDTGKLGIPAAIVCLIPFVLDTKNHIARFIQALSCLCFTAALYFSWDLTWITGTKEFEMNSQFKTFIIAGVLCFAIGFVLEKLKFNLQVSRRVMRIIVALLIIVCVVAVFSWLYDYEGDSKLLNEASQVLHGELTDSAGTGRGQIWKNAVTIIKSHTTFGSGPGTFLQEYCDLTNWQEGQTAIDFPHNDFLMIAACVGMGGLVIYILFILSLFIRGAFHGFLYHKKSKEDADYDDSGIIIMLVGVIGAIVYATFVFSIAIISPMYWIMAGLLVSETRKERFK